MLILYIAAGAFILGGGFIIASDMASSQRTTKRY